jgi:hypothetical protein
MKRLSLCAGIVAAVVILATRPGLAQYSSTNYSTNEVFFGAGSDTNQSSPNYQASVSAGSLGVGNYAGTNYKAYSGFLTPNEPFLEMQIDSTSVNLGTLDTTTANTGTATFHVRAYVDSGYTVQTVSQSPTYTSGVHTHRLAAMLLGPSVPGTEQFGINLVHNTSPVNFGADPSPQPSSTFATGVAASGYNTANQFKYQPGNIIAQTPAGASGWGLTNYTISYIANISLLTPAGNYTMAHDLVIVATY